MDSDLLTKLEQQIGSISEDEDNLDVELEPNNGLPLNFRNLDDREYERDLWDQALNFDEDDDY